MFTTIIFTTIIEDCFESTDSALDDRLREIERDTRRLQAERAGVLTVIESRGAFAADGHRSTKGYLRSTCNLSSKEANRRRLVATVCNLVPELGEWLYAGRVGEVQIVEIARIHQNPRTRDFFTRVAPVYLEFAEHDSHDELKGRIDDFITVVDEDGAFAELVCNLAERTASAHIVGGALSVRVSGGDPVAATEFVEIFDLFVEREFLADVEARRICTETMPTPTCSRGPTGSAATTRCSPWPVPVGIISSKARPAPPPRRRSTS